MACETGMQNSWTAVQQKAGAGRDQKRMPQPEYSTGATGVFSRGPLSLHLWLEKQFWQGCTGQNEDRVGKRSISCLLQCHSSQRQDEAGREELAFYRAYKQNMVSCQVWQVKEVKSF